jgi:predicted nucleotidyltransferase
MNVTGIIVEYNPLHNGHIYHINKTKEITGCNFIVAVMSGNFVQRGEPSLVNKWVRTEMALKSGIDLVVELPFIYSTSSAEGFAFGAVSTLNSLGFIDNICFGSEAENMKLLKYIADILADEPSQYKILLHKYLKEGVSYPAARQTALIDYCEIKNDILNNNKELKEILNSSNNILGIEYLKSIYRLSSKINPFSIKRMDNSYNQASLTGSISSATSIRKNINNIDIVEALPDYIYNILENERNHGRCPVTLSSFSDLILYKLRDSSLSAIKSLLDVGEGLENKIKKGAESSTCINELIEYIKNKRYTSTRIQRILLYSLLGITKEIKDNIKNPVKYIRVLGFNENGKMLLRMAKKNSTVPIITNPSYRDSELLKYDTQSTDIYVLGYENPQYKSAKQDFKIPPVII